MLSVLAMSTRAATILDTVPWQRVFLFPGGAKEATHVARNTVRGLGRALSPCPSNLVNQPSREEPYDSVEGTRCGNISKTCEGGLSQANRREENVVGIHSRATNDYLWGDWRKRIRYLELGVAICRKRLPFGWK